MLKAIAFLDDLDTQDFSSFVTLSLQVPETQLKQHRLGPPKSDSFMESEERLNGCTERTAMQLSLSKDPTTRLKCY